MTAAGGIGHTLPFLISNFHVAMLVAVIIVAVELMVISYIRHRYMDTPFLQAAFQVIVGGLLVFFTGYLIGSAEKSSFWFLVFRYDIENDGMCRYAWRWSTSKA